MGDLWPFVVTRNAVLDWRAIYAPQILVDAKDTYQLVLLTADTPDGPGVTSKSAQFDGAQAGTLVFRSRPAADVLGTAEAVDRFGRPIRVIDGFLTMHSADEDVARATS